MRLSKFQVENAVKRGLSEDQIVEAAKAGDMSVFEPRSQPPAKVTKEALDFRTQQDPEAVSKGIETADYGALALTPMEASKLNRGKADALPFDMVKEHGGEVKSDVDVEQRRKNLMAAKMKTARMKQELQDEFGGPVQSGTGGLMDFVTRSPEATMRGAYDNLGASSARAIDALTFGGAGLLADKLDPSIRKDVEAQEAATPGLETVGKGAGIAGSLLAGGGVGGLVQRGAAKALVPRAGRFIGNVAGGIAGGAAPEVLESGIDVAAGEKTLGEAAEDVGIAGGLGGGLSAAGEALQFLRRAPQLSKKVRDFAKADDAGVYNAAPELRAKGDDDMIALARKEGRGVIGKVGERMDKAGEAFAESKRAMSGQKVSGDEVLNLFDDIKQTVGRDVKRVDDAFDNAISAVGQDGTVSFGTLHDQKQLIDKHIRDWSGIGQDTERVADLKMASQKIGNFLKERFPQYREMADSFSTEARRAELLNEGLTGRAIKDITSGTKARGVSRLAEEDDVLAAAKSLSEDFGGIEQGLDASGLRSADAGTIARRLRAAVRDDQLGREAMDRLQDAAKTNPELAEALRRLKLAEAYAGTRFGGKHFTGVSRPELLRQAIDNIPAVLRVADQGLKAGSRGVNALAPLSSAATEPLEERRRLPPRR